MSETIEAIALLLLLQEIRRKLVSFRDREVHYRKLAALETTPPKTREEFEMRAFDYHEICDELETILPPETDEKPTQDQPTDALASGMETNSGGILFR